MLSVCTVVRSQPALGGEGAVSLAPSPLILASFTEDFDPAERLSTANCANTWNADLLSKENNFS